MSDSYISHAQQKQMSRLSKVSTFSSRLSMFFREIHRVTISAGDERYVVDSAIVEVTPGGELKITAIREFYSMEL